MPLYFAYGSNMDIAAMRDRCPASRPLGRARLMRHRLVVMEEGYASVTRDPRSVVWGMLWDLALPDIPSLDRYESIHTGLYAKVTQAVVAASGPRRALVYVGRRSGPGVPRPGYMEGVVAAARAAHLPPAYVAELESLLPHAAVRSSAGAKPSAPAWRWEP